MYNIKTILISAFLFIGNLSNENIISYLNLEYKLEKEEDFLKVLNSLDIQNTSTEDTSNKKINLI